MRAVILFSLCFAPSLVSAEIHILGRQESMVTSSTISLGDIATVSSGSITDDDAVIGLRKLKIGDAPAPGQSIGLSGSKLIDSIRLQGVDIDAIKYRLPEKMKISRAGREVTQGELRQLVEATLLQRGSSQSIRMLTPQTLMISPRTMQLSAAIEPSTSANVLLTRVTAQHDDGTKEFYSVHTLIDDYREVPIASRALAKGQSINNQDIAMARLNISQLPPDAIIDPSEVLGRETTALLNEGEVIRKSKVAIPPMVRAGENVTMVYSQGSLEITATGVALESGIEAQTIKIKNIQSQKTVFGRIVSPKLVSIGGAQ